MNAIVSLDSYIACDSAEYHLFAMIHGVEFVQKFDNEGIIKFCVF